MTDKEALIEFVMQLTPEQADRIIARKAEMRKRMAELEAATDNQSEGN